MFRIQINKVSIIRNIRLMRNNPFNSPDSPILHLYQKSRSKSQSNRAPVRNRSKSFREYQVKIITNALDNKHVIQKQANKEKQKQMKRQRQLSKYYGPDNYKVRSDSQQSLLKKTSINLQNKVSSNRNSERISTLINIKPQTANYINSHKIMSYQSNYLIRNQSKHSDYQIQSSNSVSQPSSVRSGQRKISFFSQINNPYQQANQYRKSRFINQKKSRVDKVKEQDYDEDYMLYRKDIHKMSFKAI